MTISLHHSGRTEGQMGYPEVIQDIWIQETELHTILFPSFFKKKKKKKTNIFLIASIVLFSLRWIFSFILGCLKRHLSAYCSVNWIPLLLPKNGMLPFPGDENALKLIGMSRVLLVFFLGRKAHTSFHNG